MDLSPPLRRNLALIWIPPGTGTAVDGCDEQLGLLIATPGISGYPSCPPRANRTAPVLSQPRSQNQCGVAPETQREAQEGRWLSEGFVPSASRAPVASSLTCSNRTGAAAPGERTTERSHIHHQVYPESRGPGWFVGIPHGIADHTRFAHPNIRCPMTVPVDPE